METDTALTGNEVNNEQMPASLTLWAKTSPYKQLLAHMIDVGYCVKEYLLAPSSLAILSFLSSQWNCPSDTAVSFAAYLASLHDIGKATPHFQKSDDIQFERLKEAGLQNCFPESSFGSDIRHEQLSMQIFKRLWRHEERELKESYGFVLALHHQRRKSGKSFPIAKEWEKMEMDLDLSVRRIFNAPVNLLLPNHMDAVCTLLTGLIILCDWVASSGPFNILPKVTDMYCSESSKIAKKTLNEYGLIGVRTFPEVGNFNSIWPQITRPHPVQKQCISISPESSLTIIEAPMGEGKTEAALYLAARICSTWKKRGIYVALPTQATSNQMHSRVDNMLDNIHAGNARLLHGIAYLFEPERENSSDDPNKAGQWLRPLRMGLLAENGVGTVDQAMASVLISKFSILRLLGLTNKVLVIDEIHAYDAYMSEIIKSLLYWCQVLRIPVILLSATLQNSQREAYLSCFVNNQINLSDRYPLITQATNDGKILQIECNASVKTDYKFEGVRFGENCNAIANYSVEKVKSGGCYCVLVNTVRHAQKVYLALLEAKDSDTTVILYHARFPLGTRQCIEKKCLSLFGKNADTQRPAKAILVATQVVEQSLDIDFDGMLTELAPIDLLLQRAGRVHRHRNRVRPSLFSEPVIQVVLPSAHASSDLEKRYGISGYVYAPFLLYNTERMLQNGILIRVPEDVRGMIAQVYDNITEENKETWKARIFKQEKLKSKASSVILPIPCNTSFSLLEARPILEQENVDDGFETGFRVSTRWGEPSVRIAFCSSNLALKIQSASYDKETEREILLASVSLAKRFTDLELENSVLRLIKRGHLKGCYVSAGHNTIQVGKYTIRNDSNLGIVWEE